MWADLKKAIASVIKTNNNQEITGQVLQNTLNSIVDTVGENATFAGIATPDTNPGVPDGPVFYLNKVFDSNAIYANFGNITIDAYTFCALLWHNKTWDKHVITTFPMIVHSTGASTTDIMSQKAVTNELSKKINKEDIVQELGDSTVHIMSQKAVSELIENGYIFKGELNPRMPITIKDSVPIFYATTTEGVYPNFGGIEVTGGELNFLMHKNGVFYKRQLTNYTSDIKQIKDFLFSKRKITTNSIFTIIDKGINSNMSSSIFGQEVNLSGFSCSDFIRYIDNTEIEISVDSTYSNFGITFYDINYQPVYGIIFNTKGTFNIKSPIGGVAFFRLTRPSGNNGIISYYIESKQTKIITTNKIFTIKNKGILASSKSANFGNEVSMKGFNCSDFVPYVIDTNISVTMVTTYGTFGLVFYDSTKNPIEGFVFSSSGLLTFKSTKKDACYFRITEPSDTSKAATYTEFMSLIKDIDELHSQYDDLNNNLQELKDKITDTITNYNDSLWKGKTIYFCGTSIPQGGYPQIACNLLGATCINKAIGSSVLRKALRDGGGFTQFSATTSDANYVRAFTATKAEKEELFKSTDFNQYSYEELLLPYLNGTYNMPDLFVIDYASDDKVRSGKNDPYFTEINTDENSMLPSEYELAEDSLTSSRGVAFNRNTYTGAANFIISLILQYNPQARIILIGFQNKQLRSRQVVAQKTVADYWQIPLLPLSDLLGWSECIIYGSKDKFNSKYSPTYSSNNDVSAMKMWCPDGIHPHSNTHLNELGYKESNYEIAKKVASFINTL